MKTALVLCATRDAIEQAQQLLPPGVVLENWTQQAIQRGDVVGGTSHDGGTMVALIPEHGVEVVVTRTRSPSSGRKAWLPSEVRRLRQRVV